MTVEHRDQEHEVNKKKGGLVLSRFLGEEIIISKSGQKVLVTVVGIGPDRVRLSIQSTKGFKKKEVEGEVIIRSEDGQDINLFASIDANYSSRAKIAIRAPRDFTILRGEMLKRDRLS